jgi:hypothetical protein
LKSTADEEVDRMLARRRAELRGARVAKPALGRVSPREVARLQAPADRAHLVEDALGIVVRERPRRG